MESQLMKSVVIQINHTQGPWDKISMVTFKESEANTIFVFQKTAEDKTGKGLPY